MGLRTLLYRQWYIWSWRVRHWLLDTRQGAIAQILVFVLSIIVWLLAAVRIIVTVAMNPPVATGQLDPVKAAFVIDDIIIYLIVILVAVAVSIAMRPKTSSPAPTEGDMPTVEDGQPVRDCFGDVWIDDSFLLAWKVVGKTPIRTKGGKK